ncbi:hypothetical protein EUZ95_13995 [Enterococcus durans]|uniref:accessory gene regulator B family protein n=1 Tax=Enterococcus durans TaxID=53345 RepID=UPI00103A4496|nr:hypothetical protein EUZ95_13995 [Enterococcus durans]
MKISEGTFEEKFVGFLVNRVSNRLELSREDSLKIEYGLNILVINLVKMIIIYSSSITLECFKETLIVHSSFCILRRYNYGFHFNSNLVCTLFGILLFVLFPFTMKYFNYDIPIYHNLTILLILNLCIISIGPSHTKNQLFSNEKNKLKPILFTMLLSLSSLFLSNTSLDTYLTSGIFSSVLLVIMNTIYLRRMVYEKR